MLVVQLTVGLTTLGSSNVPGPATIFSYKQPYDLAWTASEYLIQEAKQEKN